MGIFHRPRALMCQAIVVVVTIMASLMGVVPRSGPHSGVASAAALTAGGATPGVQIYQVPASQQAAELNAIKASGATWIRLDLFWPVVEPSRGVFTWSEPDPVVFGALNRGLKVMLIGSYTPQWTNTAGDPQAYAEFMTAAAQRYSPRGVHTYEIWNEPNVGSNWSWQPHAAADPVAYTATLEAAYAAVKAVDHDPTVTVVAGALANASDTSNDMSSLTFLQGMYTAGARGYFDVLSAHPSSFPDMPMTPDTWNAFWELPQLHQVMGNWGDIAKKIWLTEYGAPTGTSSISVSEAAQADMLYQAFLQAPRWSWAGPVFSYWQDSGSDLNNPEFNFGIVRFSQNGAGSHKAAYNAFEYALGKYASGWTPTKIPAQLTADQFLGSNQAITNQTTHWSLVMQGDGNLVLNDSIYTPRWSTNTQGNPGARVYMQGDGNLVVYSANAAIWSSNTQGHPQTILLLRDDNNLVIQDVNRVVLWATGTH